MANNKIQVKRTNVSGRTANVSNSGNSQYIDAGEFALNMADGILYSSNGSSLITVGANQVNQRVTNTLTLGNSSVNATVNSTAFTGSANAATYLGSSINSGNSTGIFTTGVVNASGIVSGSELTSTLASGDEGGQVNLAKPPNATTSGGVTIDAYQNKLRIFEQGGSARGVYIDLTAASAGVGTNLLGGTGTVTSVGSANGIAGGPITGSGTLYAVAGNNTVFVNASGIHVNTSSLPTVNLNSQYVWTNTQTFQANISFTGNNISLVTNTGSIFFAGSSDANWRIGRNTGGTTKYYYTNNSLDIIAANSNLEGIVFGWTGNSYLETGYAGTFTQNPIYVGNSSVNVSINSTAFTGTANNANYVKANNGITSNSFGVFVTQGDGTTVNSTGVHVRAGNTQLISNSTGVWANQANFDHNSLSNYDANKHVDHTSVTLTAGAGLTGGGTIAASRTFDVGAGNGIAVDADSIRVVAGTDGGLVSNSTGVFVTAGQGLLTNSTGVHVGVANGITGAADSIAVTEGVGLVVNATGVNVKANNGITANSTGTFVTPGSGIVVNATGVHVNQTLSIASLNTTGNVVVGGNLTVQGNVVVIGANNLSIVDNFIYLNSNNTTQNIDLGFAGNYNDGTYKHAGFFRDATDGFWKPFDGYTPEPDAAVDIDTSNNTFNIAGMWFGNTRIGNTTVYASINSTAYSGSANNATNLNGQAASFYTNATNITTGTLPYAQIPANIVNTSASFTLSGVTTFGANVILGSSGLSANGGFGTASQVLHSNGTATYWAADDQGVTSIASGNGITGGTITSTGTLTAVAGAGLVVNTSGINVLANTGIVANSTGTFVNAQTPLVANSTGLHIAASAGSGTFSSGISAITVDSVGRVTSVTGSAGYITSAVTSVASGNGITGGTITATGTLTADAGAGMVVNSSGINILANTGIVANATGAYVNATYIGTLSANNTTFVNNKTEGNLNVNSASFASRADAITGGSTSQVVVQTALNTTGFRGVSNGITFGATNIYADVASPLVANTTGICVNTTAGMQILSLGVGTANSATTGEIRATNDITAFYSDARLKGDVHRIENALDKVNRVTGVTYRHNELAASFGYTSKSKRLVGVLAHELEAVLPEAVCLAPFDMSEDTDEDGNPKSKSGENYKTVKYDKVVPLLIEAIKELTARVDELKKKLGE